QAFEVARKLRTGLETPAARYPDQLHGSILPVDGELGEQVAHGVGGDLVVEKAPEHRHGQRLVRAQQRGLDDAFRFGGIHRPADPRTARIGWAGASARCTDIRYASPRCTERAFRYLITLST